MTLSNQENTLTMPEHEPNGTPAASLDAAGQRPTTDGTSPDPQQSSSTDSAASGQQSQDGQQQDQQQVQNPEAKKASEEAARYRKQLRDVEKRLAEYEAKEQAAKDAELPAIERAEKRAAEAERKYADSLRAFQEKIVGLTIQVQASKLNIIDADAAVKLMDWSQLEYDEDGVPTNADTVLAALVKAKPYLVAPSASAAPASQQSSAPPDANTALAAQLGATNPTRQNGPITVTVNQAQNKAFQEEFKQRYGMSVMDAMLRGKVQVV